MEEFIQAIISFQPSDYLVLNHTLVKGGNVQNIPVRTAEGKMVRRLFKPDPGLELTGADGEQAEAREVAWMAGDTRLIELFQTPGYDVHWAEAKRLFDIPKRSSI